MKTLKMKLTREISLTAFVAAGVMAVAAFAPEARALSRKPSLMAEADNGAGSGGTVAVAKKIKIEVLDTEREKKSKEVAWLGVASEEASEVLGAQLGLQPGDGLVVVFVEPDSPAARAGLQKHDVMVEFGDQLLVHPAQFRKLVRRQKEGDKIKLTFYRSGKKQSVSATLAKTFERVASLEGMNNHEFQLQFSDPENAENVHGHLKGLHESLAQTGLTRKFVNVEVQRGLEQARKAIRETLSRNGSFATALGSDAAELEALTRGDVEKSTTVTVNKNAKSVKTMVKADDTGTYVLVANPKRRLTVHGKDGKLLFDGEVETKAQQEKVPEELRSKAQRMLKEMGPVTDENARPEARSAQKPKG